MFLSAVAQGMIDEIAPALDLTLPKNKVSHHGGTANVTWLCDDRYRTLYTLHMLRRLTVLDAARVDLPQRDKDRFMVMSIGGNDIFGPDAHRVTEWKKDPATESAMLIATTVDEQAKASRKLCHPTSSSSRPPRSMAHQSPLDATPAPMSRESYHRPAGPYQPRNDPYKGSGNNKSQNRQSYKQHYSGYCAKGKQQPKDQSNSCQSQNRSEASSCQDKDRKTSQQSRNFKSKKGREEAVDSSPRTNQLLVGGKLTLFKPLWSELFPDNPEMIRKISKGILIAFRNDYPTLLRCPLELHSSDKVSDLQQAVHKLLESHAIEEVSDPSSPAYYCRLFLVPKPGGTFLPIINSKKLKLFLEVPSFKMETLFPIIAALQPQEWITKMDLKDAYHRILVYHNIWKFFQFMILGKTYQFRVLPFVLSRALREFTKTLAWVVQLLRARGIRVHAYLDDWVIRADSPELCACLRDHTSSTIFGVDD